jgi:hypothetical protein
MYNEHNFVDIDAPVPRRLFFAAQQRIAIAQSPKLHQKIQL